jgi:hypothetical protein
MKTKVSGRFYKLLPTSLPFTTDRYIKLPFLSGFVCLLLQIMLLALAQPHLPPEVPLFYSRPWGELQLASKNTLWLLPFSTTLVFILNLALASLVNRQERLLARILIGTGGSFSLLATYTLIKIIMLIWC